MLILFLSFATAVPAAYAAIIWRKSWSGESRRDSCVAIAGLIAVFIVCLEAARALGAMLSRNWNFIRLAPSVALLQGYDLYYPADSGPVLGWIYGPVLPLMNLPAAALPHPVPALVVAGILNIIMLLLPLLLFSWRSLPIDPRGRIAGVTLLAATLSCMLMCTPSRYWLENVHADTPALGFGLLGLGTLLWANSATRISPGRLFGSACLLGIAVFAKQSAIALIPLPVLFVGLRDGLKRGLLAGLLLLLALLMGWGGCMLLFDKSAFILNIWTVPSRHPWDIPGFGGLWRSALDLFSGSGAVWILFVGLLILDVAVMPHPRDLRIWILGHPWAVLVAAAALTLPLSLMGRTKVGGDVNSHHTVYYILAAVHVLAANLIARGLGHSPPRVLAAIGIPCVLACLGSVGTIRHLGALEEALRNSRLAREYAFSSTHPEQVFFTDNPLVTLYTDRELYHQGYGIKDRALARLPLTPEHLAVHLPGKMCWVSSPSPRFWIPEGLSPDKPPPELRGRAWYSVSFR